jgi:acylpyruvate hydrolase
MRIATVRIANATAAFRVEDDRVVEIPGFADVGALLQDDRWRELAATAAGPAHPLAGIELDLLIPQPGKVLCVGLNYRRHILEMGRELPPHPTVFAKFADTLTAPYDDIAAVPEDPALDWEGELALVIGRTAYRVAEADADGHIAGYAIANDISMRTYQNRTPEWLQGKMWARSTPVGPHLVTSDEFEPAASTLRTTVNGRTVQEESLGDLLFSPAQLVAYLSAIIPLRPGDIVLTGTPGGVGHARRPQEYLRSGDVVEVEIDGIGRLRNTVVAT